MKTGNNSPAKHRFWIDAGYFWAFWIVCPIVLFWIFGNPPVKIYDMLFALALPHVIPVTLAGLLFERLFNRKKTVWFFLIAIPALLFIGLLQNRWFEWIVNDDNIHVNNEILIYIFLALFIGFRYIRLAVTQRMLLKEAENKRVTAELQLLRTQLNPHFLFNALNSIYALIITQSPKAGEAVLTLSELMRFHIDLSGKQIIPLERELDLIRHYVELEKLKLGDRCRIAFTVEGHTQNTNIAPLMLLPFVENAFKHGITDVAENNFVTIHLETMPGKFRFGVINSIPAKKADSPGKETKTGIENTRKRLNLHYKGDYSLDIKQSGQQFEIMLTINTGNE